MIQIWIDISTILSQQAGREEEPSDKISSADMSTAAADWSTKKGVSVYYKKTTTLISFQRHSVHSFLCLFVDLKGTYATTQCYTQLTDIVYICSPYHWLVF